MGSREEATSYPDEVLTSLGDTCLYVPRRGSTGQRGFNERVVCREVSQTRRIDWLYFLWELVGVRRLAHRSEHAIENRDTEFARLGSERRF